jgi:hypothetical protein
MKMIITSVVAISVFAVLFGSEAQANGRPTSHGSYGRTTSHAGTYHASNSYARPHNYGSYHVSHGTQFSHGYFYRGHNHSHWSRQCYSSQYGCTVYWDSGCSSWYYYCNTDSCYYPVSYCPYGRY